jgi:hypothetical protein
MGSADRDGAAKSNERSYKLRFRRIPSFYVPIYSRLKDHFHELRGVFLLVANIKVLFRDLWLKVKEHLKMPLVFFFT